MLPAATSADLLAASKQGAPYVWPIIEKGLGPEKLRWLYGVWYEHKFLNEKQKEELKILWQTYHLGQKNFETWYKLILRQVWENSR